MQASLPLAAPPATPAAAAPEERRASLWLCIHLPRLTLESVVGGERDADEPRAVPRAVFEEREGRRLVQAVDAQAAALGVTPGLTIDAALALAPRLETLERDPAREAELLERLAEWAGQYTSLVSLQSPDELLLEVRGSLRLFRGVRALWRTVSEGLERHGHRARLALAPTPLAAAWLARAGTQAAVGSRARLARRLNALPLACLRWPAPVVESLAGMGVRDVGACRRLPREGFARRFGAERLLALDRAFGLQPDPRSRYRAPECYEKILPLEEETDDLALILEVCRRLLGFLEKFLLERDAVVQRLRLRFFHLGRPATDLGVGLSEADRDAAHWQTLVEAKLERLALPAAVIAVALTGGRPEHRDGASETFAFSPGRSRPRASARLVERLRARFGRAAVHGLALVDEHRPHRAWCRSEPGRESESVRDAAHGKVTNGSGSACDAPLVAARPLWLLPDPLALDVRGGRPYRHGELMLVGGPERIETGWWSGEDVARDYYVARSARGETLWSYRDRRSGAWYLHGIFG